MTIHDEIALEALSHYQAHWEWWLTLKHATETERELARMKIRLIKETLSRLEYPE